MTEKTLLPNVAMVGAALEGSGAVVPAAVAGKLDMKSLTLGAVSVLVDWLSLLMALVVGLLVATAVVAATAAFPCALESEVLVNCMLAGTGARGARDSGIRVGAEWLFLA